MEQTADETLALRRCIRDLVALSTLPAVWAQSHAAHVAQDLAEVLRRMLLIELVFVRTQDAGGTIVRAATSAGPCTPETCRSLTAALEPVMSSAAHGATLPIESPLGDGTTFRAVCLSLGYDAANGAVVAASSRQDFPSHTDKLLLGVAANAAAVVLQRRLTEELLRAANRAKDDFLATVSHELRTPVNAVLGWATLLSQGVLEGERAASAVAAIQRNARAQVRLIEDLLDVSRFLAGGTQLELARGPVRDAVDGAVDAVSLAAEAKNLAIHATVDDDEAELVADPNRLRQIIWNLVSNAVKFTPGGGRVDIDVTSAGGVVVIVVRDTGEGIDADFLPYAFDRFRQGDSSTTRVHGGLGLGLWIVRHLTELHGGTVAVTSAGRGQGSTFTVRLPASGPSA